MKLIAILASWLWSLSIIKSTLSMRKFNEQLYMDLANKEYKLVPEKIEEFERVVDEVASKGTKFETAILLLPFYNLIYMHNRKKNYKEKKQQLWNKLEEKEIITKMDAYDKNFFRNVSTPSAFVNLSFQVGHNDFPLILKTKEKEQTGEVLFTTNYDMSKTNILLARGNAVQYGYEKIQKHIKNLTNKYDNRDLFVEGLNEYNESPQSILEQKKKLLHLKKELLIHKYKVNYKKPVYQIKKKI